MSRRVGIRYQAFARKNEQEKKTVSREVVVLRVYRSCIRSATWKESKRERERERKG